MERAALVATENAPAGKRAWYGAFPQLGAPLGYIIANGIFLIISVIQPGEGGAPSDAFLTWGWRVPFVFSVVMVIIGLWVRMRLVESAAFAASVKKGETRKLPLSTVIRNNWRQLILGTFFMLATYVLFYLMTTFLIMSIIGVVFFGAFTLLSGPWRIGGGGAAP